MLLPLFDWRLLDDAFVHPSPGAANAAVESLAVIVHNKLKSSQERRRRKNSVIYAEARDFVMQRLPDPWPVQAEVQRSSSGELLATSWQKHFVPVITALMPGFFIGTVKLSEVTMGDREGAVLLGRGRTHESKSYEQSHQCVL